MRQPATEADLFARLDALGIAHGTRRHRAVFTVEDGADVKATMPGGHSKNLFLKDRDGRLVLVCALGETRVNVNRLHKALGCARLSFAPEEALWAALNVRPGSVTLFALMNDVERAVTLVVDRALLASDPIHFHPLHNEATTAIDAAGLRAFVADWGGAAHLADFTGETPVLARLDTGAACAQHAPASA
jgi:Ala-tRNA(Pro) deacylase